MCLFVSTVGCAYCLPQLAWRMALSPSVAGFSAAETVNKALLELRSYEEIQLHEAAKLGQLLIVLYRHLWSLEQYTLMVQDLSAALSGGVRDVLKFIHKGICASPDMLQTTSVPG